MKLIINKKRFAWEKQIFIKTTYLFKIAYKLERIREQIQTKERNYEFNQILKRKTERENEKLINNIFKTTKQKEKELMYF